ncbi:hypothetical protein GE061_007226 [Apolygus lucorum]|uniref:Uncharacterized protein n=1 Tax=Apolygus lucorum TaxID=248454 RepID=A0A8S9WSW6_APOLU|nr:hypothetical protein GE061_007226 [Apolygus lucorum]
MVLSSSFFDTMPQRVPTGELSPAPEDYTAVFAADSFDLSLLPSTLQGVGLYKEAEFGFPWSPIKEESLVPHQEGIPWSPIKEEPLSEEEGELGPIPDHKLLREVLKDTSFQKRYNLIPVSVGELGTGFRAEMEEFLAYLENPANGLWKRVETWLAWNLAQFSPPADERSILQNLRTHAGGVERARIHPEGARVWWASLRTARALEGCFHGRNEG